MSRDIFYLGGTHIQETHIHGLGRDGPWDRLHRLAAANAIHDSDTLEKQGICLENTRQVVLGILSDYLSSTIRDSAHVLWLNGPAGSGKSAIARTIAKSGSEAHTLLGNFFFYHSDPTRNTTAPFVPTLAVQICQRFRRARPLVERAIEDNPLIFKKSMRAQANALIIEPLKQVFAELPVNPLVSSPLTFLIDGLDECNNPSYEVEIVNALVEIVTELNASSQPRVKVVIFSRPEPWIRKCIDQHEQAGPVLSIALKDDLNPQSDIELYYKTQFEEIRRHHPIGRSLGPDWPSQEEMKALFDMTGTLFALAHTVHGFVADPNEDPKSRLKIVLSINRQRSSSPQAFLDQLYREILSRIPKSILPKTLRIVRAILVPDVYAIYPSPPLLELVFSLEEGEIRDIFSYLESLFDLGDGVSSRIRVYHKTLADFLFYPSRSKQYDLFIKKGAVRKDIQDSVCSVFFLNKAPKGPALAALSAYLNQLYRHGPTINSLWNLLPPGPSRSLRQIMRGPRPEWPPWAVAFLYQQYRCRVPMLHKLAWPDITQYGKRMVKNDKSRDYAKAVSVYEGSPPGRLCLVLLSYAFRQTFDERVETFFQAFIRHAIHSNSELLELDRSVGWNLATCNLDNLARAWIYPSPASRSAYKGLWEQLGDELLRPEWVISRLGMLRPWHDGGHRITDDPWEHAGRRPDVEVASECQLSCFKCAEVLDVCKARLLEKVIWAWRDGSDDAAFHQKLFDHVHPNTTLWNYRDLIWIWARWLDSKSLQSESSSSTADLKKIASCVKEQADKLERATNERRVDLYGDGLDWGTAYDAAWEPYSRACIPIDPPEEHAIRVARRRAAWETGKDLPEVFYTYPPGST